MDFRKTACAAAALLLASASAHAFTIDLSGQTVDGEAFSLFTVDNPSTDPVVSIAFEFIYDAGDDGSNISWGSEMVLEIGHLPSDEFVQIGTEAGGCATFGVVCEFDLMWDDTSGVFTASGAFDLPISIADGAGEWQILLADSFDDAGIDGRFLDGSYIELSSMSAVPVPAAVWFFGSALLSLFGVRRLRKD